MVRLPNGQGTKIYYWSGANGFDPRLPYMNFEKEYDELFNEVDDFIKNLNPCQIKDNTCFRGRTGKQNFCCGKTPHYSVCHYNNNGCQANKPLFCRIWLCDEAFFNLNHDNMKKCRELEFKVSSFFNKYHLDGFRKSKDELIEELKNFQR